jgi:hypothetical protein
VGEKISIGLRGQKRPYAKPPHYLAEKQLSELKVEIVAKYQTKNGTHLITKPFNPNLFNGEFGEIKKDALMLLDY